MIYYIFFGILGIGAFYEVFIDNKQERTVGKKILITCILVFLILFAGLREDVGNDYYVYKNIHSLMHTELFGIIPYSFEPLFMALCNIVPTFRLLLLTIAILTVVCRYKSFLNLDISYLIVALLFYYGSNFIFYDMGIIRQGLAMSICMMGIKKIIDKDKKFFVYVTIAAMFHVSVLLIIPLYFISNKKYSKRIYYTIIIIGVLLFINTEYIAKLANAILPMISSNYVGDKLLTYSTYNSLELTMTIIKRIVLAILFIEVFHRQNVKIGKCVLPVRRETKYTWLYINGYILSFLYFSIFASISSSLVGRMTELLYSMYIFIVIDILADKRFRILNFVYFIMFITILYLGFYTVINYSVGSYLPYQYSWSM